MQKKFIIFILIISIPHFLLAGNNENIFYLLTDNAAESFMGDTSKFQFDTASYSNNEKLANYVGNDGLSMRYPTNWERDYRSTDDIMLYLRPYDKSAPYVFREQISITSEGLLNENQNIEDYAEMILNITVDTWSKYSVEVLKEANGKFELNGMSAFRVITVLPRLSQKHLMVFFKYNAKAYTVEFIATDATFDDTVEMAWKFINSLGFVEK